MEDQELGAPRRAPQADRRRRSEESFEELLKELGRKEVGYEAPSGPLPDDNFFSAEEGE